MKDQMKLSSLDTIYLRWASQGKTSSEIAAIEGEARVDIESQLRSAALRLGAKSISDAIAKATMLNII